MPMQDLLLGVALLVGAFVLITAGRFLVAYINAPDDRPISAFDLAVDTTSRWLGSIFAGILAAGAVGLVEFADVVGMLTQFIGGHPYAVSNGLTALLGWLALGDVLTISDDQFVGLAMVILGIVLLLYEVEDDAA